MKIFRDIYGADAIRLAKVIEAAAKEGMIISEAAMGGINENSGAVWVHDEDWPGCIACTLCDDCKNKGN